MKHADFLKQLRHDDIVAAIRDAEAKTSGEIRVFISHKSVEDPVAAAQKIFEKLGMTKTREHNGVLFFVAPKAQKFAVIGDSAVHQKCGDVFWKEISDELSAYFRRSEFSQGLLHGIQKAGLALAKHFPPGPHDKNELPDRIEHD